MTLLTTFFHILLLCNILSLIPKSRPLPNYLSSSCPKTSFPANSKYQTNLKTLLSFLASKVTTSPTTTFYATASGNGTSDAVYGLYLCRGNENATACSDCVTTATTLDLPAIYCPNSRVGAIWYDECMVRYSNETILGKMADTPFQSLADGIHGTSSYEGNQTLYKETILNSMKGLVSKTANNVSGVKLATRAIKFTKVDTLYVAQQCTPDLSASDCARCLNVAIGRLELVYLGDEIMQPSCRVRFDLFPFYNFAAAANSSSSPTLDNNNNSTSTRKRGLAKVVVAIVIPVVAVLLIAAGICLTKKKAKKYDSLAVASAGEDLASLESLQYDLATLQSATNNFSAENKLGQGGFGGVYKGKLPNGQDIAVKRLSKLSGQGVPEFKNEVLSLAKLQHRRLVRLLGFCLAGEEKLLVYEYVANKSLDLFLFDQEKKKQLDWRMRYNIIKGVARGMLYLHQDSQLRIIHRDLKASNVLLDVDMNPKIADFGMAKIFGVDQCHGKTTRVVGTYGYMAPEYAMQGQFSCKSDVYSFGVLVLEILSGKMNNSFYKSGYAEDLLTYAWNQWKDGAFLDFVDETIRNSSSLHQVKKCLHLGLLCVQESTDDRPTMTTVALMLDSQTISIAMPGRPAFSIKSFPTSQTTESNDVGSNDQSLVPWSMNEISISGIEAR